MPLWQTVKLELFTPRFLISSLSVAVLYVALFAFIPNHKLLIYSLISYSPGITLNLFFSLILGLPQSLARLDLIFLLLTSILVGLNVVLLLKTFGKLNNQKVRLSIGGGSILALVATGCTSCGLSIVSLFGLSAATFSFLPFMGVEFKVISIGLLLFSFLYTLRRLDYVCEVKISGRPHPQEEL